MLQREAIERMWAECGSKNYSALSIFLHAAFRHHKSHPVSRRCFHPVPSVDSVLARMDLLTEPFLFPAVHRALIRRIFTRRRKQIGAIAKQEDDATRSGILDWLNENELAQTLRPEQIEPEAWVGLTLNGRRAKRLTPAPQHFLYFFPLPQGQGSFRPTLGASRTTGGNRLEFREPPLLAEPHHLREMNGIGRT